MRMKPFAANFVARVEWRREEISPSISLIFFARRSLKVSSNAFSLFRWKPMWRKKRHERASSMKRNRSEPLDLKVSSVVVRRREASVEEKFDRQRERFPLHWRRCWLVISIVGKTKRRETRFFSLSKHRGLFLHSEVFKHSECPSQLLTRSFLRLSIRINSTEWRRAMKKLFHTSTHSVHPSASNHYNYKSLNDLPLRPISAKVSHQRTEGPRTPPATAAALRKSFSGRSIYSSASSSSYRCFPSISLDDLLIHGQWKFRSTYDDRLQLKASGIENLVYTCYDIMYKTRTFVEMKAKETTPTIFILRLEQFQALTDADRRDLRSEQCYHLMTILFESTWTHSSQSQLIRIWREVTTHHEQSRCSTRANPPPKHSHELAMKHFLRTPDDQLLQIALHASLLSSFSRMDLQNFGDRLGIHRHQFDMGSIRDSSKSFQQFLQLFREQKFKVEREQQPSVDVHKLPYRPRKKRGLNANVAGTKFSVGKASSRRIILFHPQSISSSSGRCVRLLYLCGRRFQHEYDLERHVDLHGNRLVVETLSKSESFSDDERNLAQRSSGEKFREVNVCFSSFLCGTFARLPSEWRVKCRTSTISLLETWLLPNEYNSWYAYASSKPKKDVCAYILKPNNGAMGHG